MSGLARLRRVRVDDAREVGELWEVTNYVGTLRVTEVTPSVVKDWVWEASELLPIPKVEPSLPMPSHLAPDKPQPRRWLR